MLPLVIAHRGYHKQYHENTLESFIEASKRDVFGIECDIHFTKDKKWVIHHDDELVSDGNKYKVTDITYEELQKLHLDNDLNHKNAFVPLLEQYLDICFSSGKRPIIEIKNTPKWKNLKKLTDELDKKYGIENITFIAFHPSSLWKLRFRYHKRIHLQQLIQYHMELVGIAILFKMDIDILDTQLTKKIVNKMHKHHLKVNCWTINDKLQLDNMINLGVDYITTDTFSSEDL